MIASTYTVSLGGSDLERLALLARIREARDPDAFGELGHTPGLVSEALAEGLRLLEAREELAAARRALEAAERDTPGTLAHRKAADTYQGVQANAARLVEGDVDPERLEPITALRRLVSRLEAMRCDQTLIAEGSAVLCELAGGHSGPHRAHYAGRRWEGA